MICEWLGFCLNVCYLFSRDNLFSNQIVDCVEPLTIGPLLILLALDLIRVAYITIDLSGDLMTYVQSYRLNLFYLIYKMLLYFQSWQTYGLQTLVIGRFT